MIHQKCFLLSLLALFVVQGCSTYQPQEVSPYPEPRQVRVPPRQQSTVTPVAALPQKSIVKEISSKANQFIRKGELDLAAQAIERGLRIAPKDALLWSQLATVRLKQQRYAQAKSLAAKSTSLAKNNTALICKNRMIIEEAGR